MKRNRGFTLVELLVVMAIIAILASIVVPNVVRYIARARVARAISEINGMQLSLTAIMTDAGRGNMSQLFRRTIPGTFNPTIPNMFALYNEGNPNPILTPPDSPNGWPQSTANLGVFTPELFEAAANVYARVAYDLLRLGRDTLRSDTESVAQHFIDQDMLSRLGTNYMDIGLDPWGEVYRMWPGPWVVSGVGHPTGGRWPIPFRIFAVDAGSGAGGSSFAVMKDDFILRGGRIGDGVAAMEQDIEDWETWPTQVGFPADRSRPVFLWSYGSNQRNSQMLYKGAYDLNNPFDWYDTTFSSVGEDVAGGDDINNWDSGGSWQRFYQ